MSEERRFPMDPGEIVIDYRRAANKTKQIEVLANLNACQPRDIAELLQERGEELPSAAGHYIALASPAGGLAVALGGQGMPFYDAYDCSHCGAQYLASQGPPPVQAQKRRNKHACKNR